tara:strand:- start:26 stop:823 length:798 start_codon:yes stop_codon:yes gene_type:complete
MRVLVQQINKGQPTYDNFERSAYWFWERGYEVIRFRYEELNSGKFDELLIHEADSTIVRAGVGTVLLALQRAGRTAPQIYDLPRDLWPYTARRIWESTLGEFRSEATNSEFEPAIHIKPLIHQKMFTGLVVSKFSNLIPTAHLDDDVQILCQETLCFESEWRSYILRDRILQVCYYKGNPLLFPDPSIIQKAIPAFQDRPIAFSLDWAVTTSGATVLVEVNDGFSLGNYGLPGHLDTAMVEARWRQMMGLPDNLVGETLLPDAVS